MSVCQLVFSLPTAGFSRVTSDATALTSTPGSRPLFNPVESTLVTAVPRHVSASSAWREHIPFALFLVETLRPRVVVEVGTDEGDSFCAFCQAVDQLQLPTQCYAIVGASSDSRDGIIALRRHHDALYARFSRILNGGLTPELEAASIDLLHIDGHARRGSLEIDIDTWLPRMSSRGIVLLHDTGEDGGDPAVRRAWLEIRDRHGHFEFTHARGLGVLAVGSEIPSAIEAMIEASPDEASRIRHVFAALGRSVERCPASEMSRPDERSDARLAVGPEAERAMRELELIKSTLAYQLLRHVVWPIARWVPSPVRRAIRRAVGAVFGAAEHMSGSDRLVCGIDADLSKPLVVGKGNVLYLRGWCYHPTRTIRRLEALVAGERHRMANHSMARPDVLNDQAPRSDRTGNSLCSGFWGLVPFEKIDARREVKLSLRATLDDGRACELSIGTMTLLPGRLNAPPHARRNSTDARQPLVAICMATWNPPLDLFAGQLESILAQTHENWICIINDDCSAPATFAEMRKLAARDPRFSVHRNPARLGFYRNFERCLELVPDGSEFVAFADQDDLWYPTKLAESLAAFGPDTTLAYTDMEIVARDGRVLSSTYWAERKNNYRSLTALLFANTVTGASSVFRAALLADILPFPERIGDSYHDHWVACVALGRGRLGYVDRPLYAYRQHGGNVLGHYTRRPWTLVPRWSKLRQWVRSRGTFKTDVWSSCDIYGNDFVRIMLITRVLRLRLADVPRRRRAALANVGRLEQSPSGLALEGLVSSVLRRPTLGAEWYCLRGVIAREIVDRYFRRRSRKLFQARLAVPTASPAGVAVAPVPDALEVIEQKIAPLKLMPSTATRPRINMLVPTIDFHYFFGGYIAKFNLARQLRDDGYDVRMVTVDYCPGEERAWRREIAGFPGLEDFFDRVEVVNAFDRSKPLEVNPRDRFIATTWWTAHIAHEAVRGLGSERFIYLIQEFEPMTFPMGSFAALAEESYTFPHNAVFSTVFLREYFRQHRIGVFAGGEAQGDRHSVTFQNPINTFTVTEEALRRRRMRRLLFYARPEMHAARNMFELGVLGLRAAIRDGIFDLERWTFEGIGSVGSFRDVPLGERAVLRLRPRTTLADYVALLPGFDIGLSLMHTPHPSLVPLEMAAAGLITVTNTFENKTAGGLAGVSPNILPVPPTLEGVRRGLGEASRTVEEFERRVAGSRVNWPSTWREALGADVMARLHEFVT